MKFKKALAIFVVVCMLVSIAKLTVLNSSGIDADCGFGCDKNCDRNCECECHDTDIADIDCGCGNCNNDCDCGCHERKTAEGVFCGDVNLNGKVDIMDALEILKYLAGINSVLADGNESWENALIVSQVKPTVSDALEILKYLAKMNSAVTGEPPEISDDEGY